MYSITHKTEWFVVFYRKVKTWAIFPTRNLLSLHHTVVLKTPKLQKTLDPSVTLLWLIMTRRLEGRTAGLFVAPHQLQQPALRLNNMSAVMVRWSPMKHRHFQSTVYMYRRFTGSRLLCGAIKPSIKCTTVYFHLHHEWKDHSHIQN